LIGWLPFKEGYLLKEFSVGVWHDDDNDDDDDNGNDNIM
jgi:hypothetical protein